jgi:hypothetical protein
MRFGRLKKGKLKKVNPMKPILENLTTTPNAARYHFYRWCDYVELRCLTHKDKKFSRDNLQEALTESKDVAIAADDDFEGADDAEEQAVEGDLVEELVQQDGAEANDDDESYAAKYFRHLQWRAQLFGDSWPFEIDLQAKEIKLRDELSKEHYLYLQLLLSASLEYCPPTRRTPLTSNFEGMSVEAMRKLMPAGSQVHQFGAGNSKRYHGHLFDRLVQLTTDIHGELLLSKADFGVTNAGDGGLDIVAWHSMGDQRNGMPIAFAQVGCTAQGWAAKALEAAPARLSNKLVVMHDWATYYFTPVDLAVERDGKRNWQNRMDVPKVIMIDRLRLLKLSQVGDLEKDGLLTSGLVDEARAIAST